MGLTASVAVWMVEKGLELIELTFAWLVLVRLHDDANRFPARRVATLPAACAENNTFIRVCRHDTTTLV